MVELHWELLSVEWFQRASTLDLEALWARAIPLQIGDAVALSLASGDALAHVCLHLTIDGFSHLRGYADIAQIVEVGEVDWSAFVERGRQSRIRAACYFPLWWAKRSWGVDVPSDVLKALQPGLLRRWVGSWMTSQGMVRGVSSGRAWSYAAQMLVVDRVRDLARVLLWMFLPGPTWIRERYRLRSTIAAWAWTVVHAAIVSWQGLRSLGAVVVQIFK